MNNAGYAGTLGTSIIRMDLAEESRPATRPQRAWRRAGRRAWGLACGVIFVAMRSAIYLVVLPFAALVCLAGAALYAIQAAAGGSNG